eukprot:709694-Amphidinium_carterae.1
MGHCTPLTKDEELANLAVHVQMGWTCGINTTAFMLKSHLCSRCGRQCELRWGVCISAALLCGASAQGTQQ